MPRYYTVIKRGIRGVYTFQEHDNGTREWFKDNKLHREDGPAVEFPDGSYSWFKEGVYHRLDGPARVIVGKYGICEYWVEGYKYDHLPSEEEVLTRDIIT